MTFHMQDFEKEVIRLAHQHNDAKLIKLCMNLINRNKRLEETNAKLNLGVAPPEWGDAKHYQVQRDKLSKLARQLARSSKILVDSLPSGKEFNNHKQAINSKIIKIDSFFEFNKMHPINFVDTTDNQD